MFFLRISCTSSSSRSHACITLAFPKLLHCTVHTEIHVNYNRTIQRGITLLHHKAVFTNPCYYATLATMPLSLGPKGWHSIEVWLYFSTVSLPHERSIFWKTYDDIISCDLLFAPPNQKILDTPTEDTDVVDYWAESSLIRNTQCHF